MTLIAFVFPKLRTRKTWWDKCLKSHLSEDPPTSNMVNFQKHCCNLHHTTFIIFVYNCLGKWVAKSLSYWHAKSWYCLLTHWMSMTKVLFLIETIQTWQSAVEIIITASLSSSLITAKSIKLQSWYCFLTYWLRMTSILFLIMTI